MKPANNYDPIESVISSYSLETIDDAINADELLKIAKERSRAFVNIYLKTLKDDKRMLKQINVCTPKLFKHYQENYIEGEYLFGDLHDYEIPVYFPYKEIFKTKDIPDEKAFAILAFKVVKLYILIHASGNKWEDTLAKMKFDLVITEYFHSIF